MKVAGGRCVVFCLDLAAASVLLVLEISSGRAKRIRHVLIPKRLKLADAYLFVVSCEDVLRLDGVTMDTF